jgi:hypothetical protein
MSMRLTETERKVAELYARGLRPREIAERLGISINTVYKALSKARKLAAIADKPSPETPHHYVFVTSVYTYSTSSVSSSVSIVADGAAVVVQDLYGVVLRKLDEVLSLLKRQNKGSPDVAPATARRDDTHSHRATTAATSSSRGRSQRPHAGGVEEEHMDFVAQE